MWGAHVVMGWWMLFGSVYWLVLVLIGVPVYVVGRASGAEGVVVTQRRDWARMRPRSDCSTDGVYGPPVPHPSRPRGRALTTAAGVDNAR